MDTSIDSHSEWMDCVDDCVDGFSGWIHPLTLTVHGDTSGGRNHKP